MTSNILTYLKWRGDLTLSQSRFNEVDNLILSILSYLSFGDIIPSLGQGEITMENAAQIYFKRSGMPKPPQIVSNSEESLRWLFYLMAASPRYRRMKLSAAVDILDTANAKQFYAICIHISNRQLYLSFRGTADDLAGWKEDFLLACVPEIPSHREAVHYLQEIASYYPNKMLMLGGHSKGGNLAVYAASLAPRDIQLRIQAVWSNDGPGFQETLVASEGYRNISHEIHTIVPKSSVVGILLTHEEKYKIVNSSQIGLLQHDGFSWEVSGNHFVAIPELTKQSIHVDQAIRAWLDQMSLEDRKQVVDCLFNVLYASGATTLSEVRKDRLKTMIVSISHMKEVPKDSRERIIEFLMLLAQIEHRLNIESKLEKGKEALSGSVLLQHIKDSGDNQRL